MSIPATLNLTVSKCAVCALLNTDIHVQESYQKLKEEPGVLEDCFFYHSSADHHLYGKLLMEMLDNKHKNITCM